MSRDVIMVGSTMRISLLYRGEYSQWRERFMNYVEEQTDGEAMINSIQNGDQPLPVITQVSLVGTAQNAPPTLKDPKFWTAEEKKTRKIDRLTRSLLIQGLPNDIYSLIDSNKTAKDLWDALERKFYSKPTNNNLRTSSTSQSANKKQEFVKTDDKKVEKNADEKKRDMSKKDNDEQVLLTKDQAWMESSSDSDPEINANMVFMAQIEKVLSESDESSLFAEKTIVETKVLKDQLQVKHVVIDTHVECHEKYAKLEAERYEYMIRYSALFDNNKQHRKQIADQEVLFDKMSQTNQTVHMIMPSKDNLYNGRKGIGFENPSYFEKAKDLRPTLYDEKVIGLGYTQMFLTHSNEALEIEKFKRSKGNKIKFAYDYGNLNASYVNEKINFEDDYFQEIINPDFEKIDSLFQQTSSLKPYVPNVILEKIIIDLEDEVVNLLEKEKANLVTIESLKSKGFESSETVISESENQSENDYLVVENECDKEENSKVITSGMFNLSVSQSVSQVSMSKTLCDSKKVDSKLKRKRRKRKSSKQNVKQVNNDVSRANYECAF
nr:hypothetical protein [Tanacetum cinerariifolium]